MLAATCRGNGEKGEVTDSLVSAHVCVLQQSVRTLRTTPRKQAGKCVRRDNESGVCVMHEADLQPCPSSPSTKPRPHSKHKKPALQKHQPLPTSNTEPSPHTFPSSPSL